ncbi:MAG: shikimate kinase [Halieaceae bacterium]
MTTSPKASLIDALAKYHPLIIEGMGGYDPRDPEPVAKQITSQLCARWQADPPTKPVILVTQGDPIEVRGISAITRGVAAALELPRAMVFLDPAIADYHKPNADHHGVILEIPYSALTSFLDDARPGCVVTLERAIDAALEAKNEQRERKGKGPMQNYYRDFARLQEVTKAACSRICGEITVAHTSAEISAFSVTSFYEVGVAIGLIDAERIMPYQG